MSGPVVFGLHAKLTYCSGPKVEPHVLPVLM